MLSILFPPLCCLCERVLSRGERHVCTVCLAALPYANQLGVTMNKTEQRFAHLREVESAAGWIFYMPLTPAARLLEQIKYNGGRRLARRIGGMMGAEARKKGILQDVDAIIPVAIHPLRLMKRGYNQSLQLARGISDVSGVPVRAILRAGLHRSQTRLSAEMRRENVKDVFRVAARHGLRRGMRVLLVDDVCTTGATLSSMAEALIAAVPGLKIRILTLATVDR